MKRESGPGPLLIVKWGYNGDTGPPSNGHALRPPQCGPSQKSDGGRPTSNWFSSRGPRRANHVKTTHIFTPPYPPKALQPCQAQLAKSGGPPKCKAGQIRSERRGSTRVWQVK